MSVNKKQEQKHYMIAWFCSVLLFFLLGGWYLSPSGDFLQISSAFWACFLFLYVLTNASYHCYHLIFPYGGERRNLVFADLSFIVLCTILKFPTFVILILLNTQITLLLLSLRQQKQVPKRFFTVYILCLIALCMLVSESSSHKIIAFIVLFCGESIFILSLWYGFAELLNEKDLFWKKSICEIQENRIKETFDLQKDLRSFQKNSNIANKGQKQLQKTLSIYKKFLRSLEDKNQTLIYQRTAHTGELSLLDVLSFDNKNLCVANTVEIHKFLKDIFSDLKGNESTLKIQMEEGLCEVTLPLEPACSWILYQWLLFVSEEKEQNLFVSQTQEYINFKAVVKANVESSNSDETSCPICSKNVRSLYDIYQTNTACSQCCRKILENKLRNEDSIVFQIMKKILNYYSLGSMQCGISSGGHYEYFFTIQLNKKTNDKTTEKTTEKI